ncbi:uncharacterized protein PHACADRAFT_197512 [Phanerochaete carnosa HHB-10118-sp]|uniref:Very-long-chain (3R)-3-hydroxyacyl-CoA dehydratase n=1 Tax=Phanerochaete carnosa (strain HHB-10118-sp) TaxID=650164 RepID=K5W1S6_PHACS|nr:uncharacterized protein PHACADRAFT_197512 [Phanerochaete carnosa HHB-10118-sp]EKM53080.1 hypothetical protein PHACADRAFT_197512 [Phanerochaete carnosa HHB-10118-sp]
MSDPASQAPSSPSLQPVSLHFDNTLGALIIAEILIAVLYGIASMQVYVYLHRSSGDTVLMKRTGTFGSTAVLTRMTRILDSLYLAFTSHTIYYYAVTNFMNPLALTACPWTFAANMFVGDLVEVIVTLVYAYKIYKQVYGLSYSLYRLSLLASLEPVVRFIFIQKYLGRIFDLQISHWRTFSQISPEL